jgi:hypothetical protein
MDLSRLSDDDLRALSANNLGAMSDAGLKLIAAGGQEAPKKKGIGAALARGTESFLGAGQTSLESIIDADKAAKKGLRREEALGAKYADQIGLDKLKEAYEKKGITGAIGEVGRQVPLALAEQAPNIAASIASAKLGAVGGSAFGPVGTVVGGGLGALAPSVLQLFGSNVQRQAAEQEAAGKPVDINVGKAAAATAVQAPLDVAATFIPLGGRIAGKVFGPEVEKLLSRGGTKAAEKLAQESLTKTLAKGTAFGAAVEVPTEITQQMLERYQAGLPLTTPDALKEYGEVAYQSGLLGPIGAVGRVSQRSGARAEVEQQKEIERVKAAEEQARQDQIVADEKAQADLIKAQAETGQLFGEATPEASAYTPPKAPSTLTVREREYSQIADLEAQAKATTDPVEKKRLETEAARLKEQPSQRAQLLKDADTYDKQLLDIEKQRDAAAEKGDFKQFATLDAQARALEESQKKISAALKEMPVELTPEMEMAKLRGEQKSLIKQLQGMTGPSYDAKKAATVTAKLEEIDKRINEIAPAAGQMDLFDEAQIGAEQRAAVQQQKEQRAQEQEDFFAQTKGREVIDENAMKRYQEGLQELEDAYAAGADERIVNQLIEKLQQIAQERDQSLAKSQSTPTGEEMEVAVEKEQRIKRAIKEEENKLYDAKTNEEVATIRANVDVLKRRLASMRTERAIPQPENIERQAKTDQTEAVRDAVEATRAILSGDYFNSFNVDAASSLKSGLEADIQDAGALYTKAAIAEINNTRQKNKQTQLTTDEGLRLATAIRSRFAYLSKDPTYLAEKVREKNQKIFEDSLERIKDTFRKGKSTVQKSVPVLKQERDVLGMLRKEKAKKEPDQKRIAQIEKEVAARKAEETKIEAQKEKQETIDMERYAPSGISPDQKDLFSEKDLEPIAIVRATPANFLRFVNIQANRFEKIKKIAEDAIKKPMQKVKVLFGEKYAKEFGALENIRLQLENENKKIAPELYTPSEADIKRYSKAFITARIEKAKNIREKHFANIKNLEDRQKEILEKLRGTETTALVETLASKVAAQRQFVFEVIKADEFASNLKENATQLWQARGKIVKALENATKKERAIYEKALAKLDEQAPQIKNAIDSLHARANELLNANLKTEKAILKGLEKKLADSQKGTPASIKFKKEADEARARIGKAEAERERNLERQAKEKRDLEEKQAAALKALPSTRQEIIETTARLPGEKEVVKQKRVVKRETPKTAAEKRAEMIAEEKEAAKERQAIREQVKRGLTPQQMETEVKKFRAAAAESRKKGNEKQAKRQEDAANSLEKQLKSKMAQARMAMTGAKDTKTAQPPKMKTGVAKEPKARKNIDYEQEALDAGVSREDYEFVEQGLAFGFKARAEKGKGKGVSQSEVQARINKVKMPKGLKVVVLDKLPPSLAERIAATGYKPEEVRGGVLPDGTVIIVAENHTDMKDVERTIAHELIGHVGVEGLIGESGMKALAKQIQKTENSVFELAKKLGVLDDVLGAYAVARKSKSEEDSVLAAVRELIAHTEETRPDKNFLQKAGEFIKAMIGAVRSALRKLGLDLDISTSDIYKLLRDARKNFNEGSPGAYVNKDGDIVFRTAPAQANAGFADVLSSLDGVIAQQKSLKDRILGEATGLIFKTKYIDRFAPVQAVANKMQDSLKATQLMYFLRMHDQRMAFNSEIASNGPIDLKPAKDGKGLVIESTPGANLKDMAAALKDADVGNTEATVRIFTLYLAAKRAKRVGLDKLNFGGKVTQKMLDDAEKAVNASPKTKVAFEKAAGIYAKYNEGLINFAVKTGALSKDLGKQLLKDGDYVPFYRQTSDGSVFLDIGGAPAIKIGNLKDQPYLHELVGGDQPILDVFTSALQNTSMLTDMALRNLATRNVAYALGDMGLLKVGEKEKGSGIRKGDGPTSPTVIRFKMDGENYYADVNTKDAGVPAELLVKGLEGVNTALPNAVKLMNIPANLLRKWVTRNPAYALRQVIRDPLNAVFVTGVNTTPIASSMKEIAKMVQGKSEGEPLLQRRGVLGGQVLTGTAEDMGKILRDVTAGKKGWDYQMARLDSLAIKGDAATRVVMYNNFIKQGLSEMEATLATLEAMNFSKRGISPSLFALSTMVPFMNAQIQGLNVIYQAFTGQMPFNEKLKVKQKLYQRAAMMVGFTMLYASLMQDDESYQNANDDEKYNNWFMPNPFGDEYIKIPIPFEIGFLFKAVPEALVNTAFGDEKARDTLTALGKMAYNSMPISMPQGIKPALETAINYSFFTGRPIESERLQRYEPGERYTERTSEIAKLVGGALNISPVKIEYLIRGYTGSLPLAIGSLANPVLRSGDTGEQPDTRGLVSSETPLIGSFFQPKDAGGLINKAYKDMEEVIQAKETYKKMVSENREREAEDYLEANADIIAMSSLAGKFRQQMGKLTQQERAIRSDSSATGAEKREALDEIRQAKIELAKMFSSARE